MNHVSLDDLRESRRHAGICMGKATKGSDLTTYEVLVRGALSDDLLSQIGARQFNPRPGKTLVIIDIIDQAHLHGTLGYLEDHNITIERINPV